jgi:Flp pilus assembly protein TadD
MMPLPLRAVAGLLLLLVAAGGLRAQTLEDVEKLHKAAQTEQAVQLADAIIAQRPRDAQVRFLKGVMLSEMARNAQAKAVFIALTEDFPELADPYNNLAVILASEGAWQQALEALQQALRNDPRHLTARENLGDVYLSLAVQAWADAQDARRSDNAALQRKLRLAREIRLGPPG